MTNSMISLFLSLDDKTLIKMATFERGENLKHFCMLLTLDLQNEEHIREGRIEYDA